MTNKARRPTPDVTEIQLTIRGPEPSDIEAQRLQVRRDLTLLDEARKLCRKNENYRRALLRDLLAMGSGRRGNVVQDRKGRSQNHMLNAVCREFMRYHWIRGLSKTKAYAAVAESQNMSTQQVERIVRRETLQRPRK